MNEAGRGEGWKKEYRKGKLILKTFENAIWGPTSAEMSETTSIFIDKKGPVNHPKIKTAVIALVYPPELDGKTLLMKKTSHT